MFNLFYESIWQIHIDFDLLFWDHIFQIITDHFDYYSFAQNASFNHP